MTFLFDIKYAIRTLTKQPLFTLMTVVVMALGLSISLYTYSILHTLLFKPLATKNSESLVMINGGFNYDLLITKNIEAFCLRQIRENSKSFELFAVSTEKGGSALISGRDSINNSGGHKFNSTFTQWSLFDLVEAKPLMGRLFHPNDYIEGAPPVIILGYDVWKNFFSGDPNIINKSIHVDAVPTNIIGVMPQGFAFPNYAEVWQPIPHNDLFPKKFGNNSGWYGYARLKPGVNLQQANIELKTMMGQLRSQFGEDTGWQFDISVEPFKMAGMSKKRPLLISMCIVVLLILLLTCINVANSLLSKVNEQIKDISIRVALGAPQHRLILQMLYESMIICCSAGLVAILLSYWGLEITNEIVNDAFSVMNNKPFWWQFKFDSDMFITLACLIMLTVFFTCALPAWRASTGDFNAVLRDGTRGSLSRKSGLAVKFLVISEILFSSIVLIIAASILTTTYQASRADYGVESENSLVAQIELPWVTYGGEDKSNKIVRFYENLKRELDNTQGIHSVGIMSDLPGNSRGLWTAIDVEGRTYPSIEARPKANNEVVVAGTLDALGLTLLEGRFFNDKDAMQEINPVIISQALAKILYPKGSAIGKRHRHISNNGERTGEWQTTVGVVTDVIHGSAVDASNTTQSIYHMQTYAIRTRMQLVVNYTHTKSSARKAIMGAIMKLDPDVVVYHIRSYKHMLQEPLWLITNISKLFLICGIIAFLLAATGVYTVVANSTTLRTQEIGVRRALGATDYRILRLFLDKNITNLYWGLSLSIATSIFVLQILADTLLIQKVGYYIGFLLVPISICGLVLLATYIPVKRAIKMEPAEALIYT